MDTKRDDKGRALEEGDIEDVTPNRRSALAAIGATVAAVFGAVVTLPGEAEACRRRTGITDRDPSDGVGRGRTRITDSDSGDEAQCGRGGRRGGPVRRRRCTDSDGGRYADRPGYGRRCR